MIYPINIVILHLEWAYNSIILEEILYWKTRRNKNN